MDISYKGEWGNAPSNLDSAFWIDRSLDLVEGRFEEVWMRGDTDFSLTEHLDRWDERCRFVFGLDARQNLVSIAQRLSEEQWAALEREPKYEVKTEGRKRPQNMKQRIVRERGYKNI